MHTAFVELCRLRVRIERLRLQIARGPMAKFSAVAERMAKVRAEDDAEADKLMQRLDEHEKRRPSVIARGHAFLDSQKAEMDDMESGLTQLSNLPLDESTASPEPLRGMGLARPTDLALNEQVIPRLGVVAGNSAGSA